MIAPQRSTDSSGYTTSLNAAHSFKQISLDVKKLHVNPENPQVTEPTPQVFQP
jgi:hypothetical protein